MKNQDERLNSKTIRKHCVLLVTLIVFLVIGIPIIINELYKLNKGYKTLWDAADVLAYYSAVLSGLISIVALYVTIFFTKKDTEKQIRAAQAQYNVPFFLIQSVSQEGVPDWQKDGNKTSWIKELYVNSDTNDPKEVLITLVNIGDGIAIVPRFEITEFSGKPSPASRYVDKTKYMDLRYDLHQILLARYGQKLFPKCNEKFSVVITLYYQNVSGVNFSQQITLEHVCKIKSNTVMLCINEISPQKIETELGL